VDETFVETNIQTRIETDHLEIDMTEEEFSNLYAPKIETIVRVDEPIKGGRLLSIDEVARQIGMTGNFVKNGLRVIKKQKNRTASVGAVELAKKFFKVGSQWRIYQSDLKEWVEKYHNK
jgi:hypothetical protein